MSLFVNNITLSIFWTILNNLIYSSQSSLPPSYLFFEQYGPNLEFRFLLESALNNENQLVTQHCFKSLLQTRDALEQKTIWALKCKLIPQIYFK